MPIVALKTRYGSSHPDALAMYCSDGRFTDAVEELLHGLGFPRMDTLTIPGGPALLEMLSSDSGAAMVIRKSFSFLVLGHHIRHVVLVAHEGCGYYKGRFPRDSADALATRQRADLRSAEKWVRAHHPATDVHTYYARASHAHGEASDDAHVVFDACS
jgi:hypothetical protein